ncbi:MAG TPA: VWA domain-containing protein, partial [Kofleriaceae bacterium]|nr:VWA domain-containing protein [Kofleriaceae bacterium]
AMDVGMLTSWTLELGAPAVKATAEDTPVFIPDAPENDSDGGFATLALAPPPIDVVATRLGRVVASDAHKFTRLELDAAPQLRPLPQKAQVVFVVDASRSVGQDGLASQLEVAGAYLSHVPDAEVEVVAYRRHATRLFGAFIKAADFRARVKAARDGGRLVLGNGSALEEGARVAAAALRGRKGPLRVVMVSDDLLRTRFSNALALTALSQAPAGTVVHMVALDPGQELELERDDQHALAPIALAHHGIGATLSIPDPLDKSLAKTVLGLVRPVRIDHLAIAGVDLVRGKYNETVPESLGEGTGLRVVVDAPKVADTVELTGMIWGDKFRRVVRVDAAFSKAAAAWVFSEDDHQDLSPAEMMTVALLGRAVSPVTSYLATEPGVRPSTVGLTDRDGFGSLGSGRYGTIGHGSGVGSPMGPDPAALLAGAARRCVQQWRPAAGFVVKLELETTHDEVVDVVPVAGGELPVATCIAEAAWALTLPSSFREPRRTYPLEFR